MPGCHYAYTAANTQATKEDSRLISISSLVLTLSKCTCIIVDMEHEAWIKSLGPDLTPTTAAKAAGLSYSTVLRQVERGRLSADNVIAIARAYKAGIVDSLIATEHISPDEVDVVGVTEALGYATNQQLLDEVNGRVDPDAVRLLHSDISPHFDQDEPGAVDDGEVQDDELAARRGGEGLLGDSPTFTPERSKNADSVLDADDDDGTVRDFDWAPGTYAADSTIDEGKAREERGEDPID